MSTPPEPEQGEQGPAGVQGDPGPSAYEVWLAANPGGTLAEFWDFLKGEPGDVGPVGPTGDPGDDGLAGTPGPSVFDLWLEDNPGGTREEFFESLRGPAGPTGPRSLAEIRTVNSDVRRIYFDTTTPPDGVQPGDLILEAAPVPIAGRRWSEGSAQSVPTATYTVMSLGSNARFSGGVSSVSGGIVVPVAGWYHLAAGVQFVGGASGRRMLIVKRNGSDETRSVVPDSGQTATTVTVSTVVYCSAGDAFTCEVWQNSGNSLATIVAQGFPYLAVALVGRA